MDERFFLLMLGTGIVACRAQGGSGIARRGYCRTCIALIAVVGALCFGRVTDALEPPLPRHVGFLLVARSPDHKDVQQFRQGLRDAGYLEGRDVVIDWRPVNGDYDRLPQAAAELVRSRVDVIVAEGTVSAQAATRATSTIPIVMATVADPVGSKIVSNLAHPGGNVTGLSMMIPDLEAKRLQLLKELLPRVTRVAVLWNSDTPYHARAIDDLKAVAPSLGLELTFYNVRLPSEFGTAVSAIRHAHAQAIYAIEDPFFYNHRSRLVKLTLAARLPAMFGTKAYAEVGGLMSYGVDYGEGFRRSAEYVDKILKVRQTRRTADRAADEVRAVRQPPNRKCAWNCGAGLSAPARRRGDPVTSYVDATANGAA